MTEWFFNDGKEGKGGKKGGKCTSPKESPRNSAQLAHASKKFKSMLSKMEACHTKLYEAMADVQPTSIAAIQATVSPASTQHATTVGMMIGTGAIAPELMVEQANVAMLKLTGILKAKDKA